MQLNSACIFFLRFFLTGLFLKSLLNLLQYCFCFMFWFFGHKAFGNLSCPTRDRIHTPYIARQSLNHWTTRETPQHAFDRCLLRTLPWAVCSGWRRFNNSIWRIHREKFHLQSKIRHVCQTCSMFWQWWQSCLWATGPGSPSSDFPRWLFSRG